MQKEEANTEVPCCRTSGVSHEEMFCDKQKAMQILLLLFTLPHVVESIVADTPQQNDATPKTASTSSVGAYNEPHFQPNRSGIVELFAWKYSDVGKECQNFLGPMGYAGVQLAPVTEHLRGENDTLQWLTFYQTVSFEFANRFGSISDFLEMSSVCNAVGVRVYVDVVLNHMAGQGAESDQLSASTQLMGVAGNVANVSSMDYPGVPFDADDFHKPCPIDNYQDAHEVRNCQFNGQPDLDHGKASVRERIITLLNGLIDMGVAGFRIDAAKYIWPTDLKSIYAAVNSLNSEEFDLPADAKPFFYQEVVDLGMDSVSKTEYAGYGVISEYLYAAELSTIFKGKVPLSTLINWGPAMGFLPHQDALVFVDTHESQHGYLRRELGQNQLLSYRQRRKYLMATLFMLAHPYGRIKRIMSSYYTDENEPQRGGPPMGAAKIVNNSEEIDADISFENETETIRSPEFDATNQLCTVESGWVCEHRWPAIVNMLTLVNGLSPIDDGVINFQTFGPNRIAFCRGEKAFIAFNNDEIEEYATIVHTCMPPGIYCDVISGGLNQAGDDCTGARLVVNVDGLANLALAAASLAVDANQSNQLEDYASDDFDFGVIAIHIGSKLLNYKGEDFLVDIIEEDIADTYVNATILQPSNEGAEDHTFVKIDKR